MAGHARYTALLDACVLYPLAMTDALMCLATAGFFAAKWTTRIEEEWIRSLEKQRPELVGKLGIRRDSMRDAIPDWERCLKLHGRRSPVELNCPTPMMFMFWPPRLRAMLTAS